MSISLALEQAESSSTTWLLSAGGEPGATALAPGATTVHKHLSVENPRLCESNAPDIECEM